MIEKERVKQLAQEKYKEALLGIEDDVFVVEEESDEAKRKSAAEDTRKNFGRRIINALYGVGGDPEFKKAWDEGSKEEKQTIADAIRSFLIEIYPILNTKGFAETHATNIIGQMAEGEVRELPPENVDLSELEAEIEEIKKKLGGQFGEVVGLFEKIIRLLKVYPNNRPQNVEQRVQAIVAQIKIDRIEMIENGVGDYADALENILKQIRQLTGLGLSPVVSPQENTADQDSKYEFVDPSRDDLSAYVAEWKRLWDLDVEKNGRRERFINLVNAVLIRMELEIDDFMDRAKFSEKPVGTRYKALKTFFNNMGYSFNKDSGEFSGNVNELKALYTYLHNRLSLADHFHLYGVSASMYAHFEEAIKSSFPEFGRYVTDYFLGTSVKPEKRRDETHVYQHYRVVRVLDQLMVSYYDEMPEGFEQARDERGILKVDSGGNPEFKKYQTVYVVRKNGELLVENGRVVESINIDKLEKKYSGPGFSIEEKYPTLYSVKVNGNIVATGINKRELLLKYPKADSIEEVIGFVYFVYDQYGNVVDGGNDKAELERKYSGNIYCVNGASSLPKEKRQKGYFSFGRGAWMSSGGGYKQDMKERLRADFSCLKGVRKVVEDGEIVYYYGPQNHEIRLPASKFEEALGIALGINALSGSRAEVFTALYYAIGKSPNDDKNLDLMYKCYPLAKELNLAKESVLEIPYIVLGGDVPDLWLANGAKKIGLCAMILRSATLRKLTGINSESDFFMNTRTPTIDGSNQVEIVGVRALRELDSSVMRDPKIAAELGYAAKSLDSDFPRFRNILRSIYVSRLKRDLLKLRFASPSESGKSSFRTVDLLSHKRTELQLGPSGKEEGGDFIRPFVMPPRMVMVETDRDLDFSVDDTSLPGTTAESGLQFHSNILEEYEAAAKTYEIANQPLPSLSGDIAKDVEIIVKDLEGLLKQTSLMKKDDKMIDWVYFFELLQMRMTRLIFLHREKYNIFQRRLIEPGEKILGRPIASSTIIHELRHYIENSGQTGVGGNELIYLPQVGRRVNLKIALLSVIPDEDVHHGEDRAETVGSFMANIRALFTAEGYNQKSLIGEKRVGMYAGGIQQRSMLLEVQGSAYVRALQRYQLISFLDPDTAVLTNTGMLHSGSATVKSAKESQEKEKK